MYMNINDLKETGTNMINVNDSLKAPLLRLSVKPNANTTIPTGHELRVFVDKSSTETQDKKTYIFDLESSLAYSNNVSDEFILEPEFDGKVVRLKAKVIRNVNVVTPEIEEVGGDAIVLFEGVNYISTNYTDASIEIIYPKNTDLVNLFLNTAIYGANNNDRVLTFDDIYFKDCFTDNDGLIDAEFNELTTKCISSSTGNFHIDCMGNITCNTIMTTGESGGSDIDFDSIYPVGSIYMNVSLVSPATLFGGTWERIQDKFLLCAGSTYAAGTTGGAATHVHSTGNHTLTTNEMPAHTHTQASCTNPGNHTHQYSDYWSLPSTNLTSRRAAAYNSDVEPGGITAGAGSHTHTITLNNTGGGAAHNHGNTGSGSNMPPYLSVYVWKRTA